MTAWRLLKSGDLKQLLSRTSNFFRRTNLRATVDYSEWRKVWVEVSSEERFRLVAIADSLPPDISFTLLLSSDREDPMLLFKTVESVLSQIYSNWVLYILDGDCLSSDLAQKILRKEDSRIRLENPTSSEVSNWVIPLIPGLMLDESALLNVSNSLVENPKTLILFGDHDHVDDSSFYHDPHMKPSWNRDLLASMNYMGPFIVWEKTLWCGNKDKTVDQHELLIEATRNLEGELIVHVPKILTSVHVSGDGSHLLPEARRVTHELPSPEPMVSVIIPTRDRGKMLRKCLESLFDITDYPNFEVVLIDHDSSEKLALRTISEFESKNNFKVTKFVGSFNFSAIINDAAELARGEVFVLLNNDTEIVESGWLTELVSQVCRPEVGIAGGLLLFGDNTIQHAGIHPGVGGLMGHGHKHLPSDSSGYFNRLRAVHEVAAVTGACLAIEKTTWNELGGLDEQHLPVAYNDVDLCLKARQSGLRVIFTPYSVLVHHESISRGIDHDPEHNIRLQNEIKVMEERWGAMLNFDPAYNPNLSFDGGGFNLNECIDRN
tara:strand:+ start:13 stop:1656 length:1644 start_codon:yes stop_codon:yes gene_type:complete